MNERDFGGIDRHARKERDRVLYNRSLQTIAISVPSITLRNDWKRDVVDFHQSSFLPIFPFSYQLTSFTKDIFALMTEELIGCIYSDPPRYPIRYSPGLLLQAFIHNLLRLDGVLRYVVRQAAC